MLPAVAKAGLADAVDAFMEGIAFSGEQTARVFRRRQGTRAVRSSCMPISCRISAAPRSPQISPRFRPITWSIPMTPAPPRWRRPERWPCCCPAPSISFAKRRSRRSRLFRKHGVPMALATDCNPGSSPLTSLLLAMNMGATLFRMTVAECLAGITREGARALGLLDETSARSKPANGAISRSGTSSVLPSSSIASASTRCIAECGGDMTERAPRSSLRRERSASTISRACSQAQSVVLDPSFWPRVEAAAHIVAKAAQRRRARLWHQYRLWKAGLQAHSARPDRAAPAQSHRLALLRRRPADAGADRAADDDA